jgi:hypothetical protein
VPSQVRFSGGDERLQQFNGIRTAGKLGVHHAVDDEWTAFAPRIELRCRPIGLLAVTFSLQALPRIEIPPWPRRARAERWVAAGGPGKDALE